MTPSRTISGMPPTAVASTGTPQNIASITLIGIDSEREGTREVHGVPVFDTVEQAVEQHGGPIDGSSGRRAPGRGPRGQALRRRGARALNQALVERRRRVDHRPGAAPGLGFGAGRLAKLPGPRRTWPRSGRSASTPSARGPPAGPGPPSRARSRLRTGTSARGRLRRVARSPLARRAPARRCRRSPRVRRAPRAPPYRRACACE